MKGMFLFLFVFVLLVVSISADQSRPATLKIMELKQQLASKEVEINMIIEKSLKFVGDKAAIRSQMQQEIERLKDKITMYSFLLHQFADEADAAVQRFDNLQERYDSDLETAKAECRDHISAEIECKRKLITRLEAQISTLKKEVEIAKQDADSQREIIAVQEVVVKDMEGDLVDLYAQCQEKDGMISAMNTEAKNLHQQNQRLQKEKESYLEVANSFATFPFDLRCSPRLGIAINVLRILQQDPRKNKYAIRKYLYEIRQMCTPIHRIIKASAHIGDFQPEKFNINPDHYPFYRIDMNLPIPEYYQQILDNL